jgi:gamma-glutamylcyclotransferase (GGCT)/AIG2-like uncharacterized protein YtfP
VPTPDIDSGPGLPVFVYGSLLDPEVLARRSGRRGLMRRAVPAVLPGWRRVALRGTPFPTLVRARRHRVHGLLLRLTGAPLRRLAAYEGSAYRLRRLSVLTIRGRRRALAWVTSSALAGPAATMCACSQS